MGIPNAFYSRISNKEVFSRAGVRPLTEQILQRQLALLRRTAVSHTKSPLRRSTFIENTLDTEVGRYVRRVGRPRQDWTTQVLKAAREWLGPEKANDFLSQRGITWDRYWQYELRRCFRTGL